MTRARINVTYYGKREISLAKSLAFVDNVPYLVNKVSYRSQSIDLKKVLNETFSKCLY